MRTISAFALVASFASPAVVQSQTYTITREGAFAMKANPKDIEAIYRGKFGRIDDKRSPWRPVTQSEWSRGVIKMDTTAIKKFNWSLSATADYDGDGSLDTARLFTNGRQTAVIVSLGNRKPPMVVFKKDSIDFGLELEGQGHRFLLSVPELGYKILFMHKGRPALMSRGD